ncbi:CoA ester lyase [Paralimibaculum aggregatum]|uniref:CoA ester lyase n=1 Tax=Paralimibaculum aggregatum TaxID=3036245 RepID=A0ABQ6LJ68_9RHOB|nr:CoA ester lyase [Limibaculum sp. NKW23]GMG83313.1 CoA ester lyase [Limibaculum sp. NKW23]
MQHPVRPRRSVLYMPGSRQRALEKARTLPADALILDLEDAVAIAEKDTARSLVAAAVREKGFGRREVIVRINGLDTQWGEADLEMAAFVAPDAILIPKVEDPDTVTYVARRLATLGASDKVAIWAMMETPLAMLRAPEIAASHPRLACLVMGTNDLVKELHAEHTETRTPVITALGLCLLAARAHKLAILDGVYNAIKDEEALAQSCRQGKEFGMDGKTLIHPSQIDVTNRIFAPSPEEIDLAKRYVAAFREAEAAGRGVAVVDGRLVENLHVETAKRLLEQAEMIGALEADLAAAAE